MQFDIWTVFRKSVEKCQVLLKSDKSNVHMKTILHLWQYLPEYFLEWEIFQIKVGEKVKIQVVCTITFSPYNRAFREIISKNILQPEATWQYGACALHAALLRRHAHKHTPAPVHPHARTRTHPRALTHARARSHTRMAFPRLRRFLEGAFILRCT
jgi:hypothetical protein